MKKISSFFLILAVALTCAACGNSTDTKTPAGSAAKPTEQTEGSGNSGSLTQDELKNFDSDSTAVSDTDSSSENTKDSSHVIEEEASDPNEDSDEDGNSNSLSADSISITYGDYTIRVLDCEETTDINGCPALRASYSFTNNASTQAAFGTTVVTTAYQNELRLANTSPAQSDAEYSAQLNLIQPGESVICASYYLLDNTSSDVVIQVSNLLNSSDETLSLRYTFQK